MFLIFLIDQTRKYLFESLEDKIVLKVESFICKIKLKISDSTYR